MRDIPGEVLDAEIRRIVDLGVELCMNCTESDTAFETVIQSGDLENDSLSTSIARGMAEAENVIARLRGTPAPKPVSGR